MAFDWTFSSKVEYDFMNLENGWNRSLKSDIEVFEIIVFISPHWLWASKTEFLLNSLTVVPLVLDFKI